MVSVIIPTYNRSETIERSVLSVLNQTYEDLECIVVDDCSTDDTRVVVSNINDSRLRYYCLEKNSGACIARNKGIDLAMGEYIAFQDSDDVWRKNKLEVQMDALSKSGADVCYGSICRFSVDHKSSKKWPNGLNEGIVPYDVLYRFPRITTQTIIAKNYVFNDFKFDKKVKKTQDYDWAIRAGEKYTFFFVSEILVDQYFQKDSISIRAENDYKVIKECRQYMYDKYKTFYAKYPKLEIVLLQRVAFSKVLVGENAADDYKRLYQLSKREKDYLKYLLEKTAPGIFKEWNLHIHKKFVRRDNMN